MATQNIINNSCPLYRFHATKGVDSLAATGDGTAFNIICNTAVVNDTAPDGVSLVYNSATGLYTVPVTGDFAFMCIVNAETTTTLASNTSGQILLNINNNTYQIQLQGNNPSVVGGVTGGIPMLLTYNDSINLPLTVGDTVGWQIVVAGSLTKNIDLMNYRVCSFSGYRLL